MLSNNIIINTIEELSSITRTSYAVYSDDATMITSTFEGTEIDTKLIYEFIDSNADSQIVNDICFFAVRDEGELAYILVAASAMEDVKTMGRVVVCQLKSLLVAYKERLDHNSFYQNLILDNMLLVDIHNKAQKLHIDNDVRRIVYIVETQGDRDNVAMEVLKSMYIMSAGHQILSVDEQNIIMIKDIDENTSREELRDIASSIQDMIGAEAMIKCRVAYGLPVKELKDISKSYKEAKMALDVGNIFYTSSTVLSYENLGIGRLIYQLPLSLCELFVKEVFGEYMPEEIDEETLTTVNKFFENNLNVSEASRQLYIHRNTLVYRMEKLQKAIGLDMRVFEDALTFKIAMMVVDYVNYLHNKEI